MMKHGQDAKHSSISSRPTDHHHDPTPKPIQPIPAYQHARGRVNPNTPETIYRIVIKTQTAKQYEDARRLTRSPTTCPNRP